VDFYITDKLHKRHSTLNRHWIKYNEALHQLFIDCKKGYDTVRREVLHSILTEFCIPMKKALIITIHLNKTYSKDCQNSVVGIVTHHGLDCLGSNPTGRKRFYFLHTCPDRLSGPPSLPRFGDKAARARQ
jgi:hypothetical protein